MSSFLLPVLLYLYKHADVIKVAESAKVGLFAALIINELKVVNSSPSNISN